MGTTNTTWRREIYLKRHDTEPAFEGTLIDADGNPINLVGATGRLLMMNAVTRNKVEAGAVSFPDPAAGRVRYEWTPEDTKAAGVFLVDVEITYGDGGVESFPNRSHYRLRITDDAG